MFCFVCPLTQPPHFLIELANQKQQEETSVVRLGQEAPAPVKQPCSCVDVRGPSEERQGCRDVLVRDGPGLGVRTQFQAETQLCLHDGANGLHSLSRPIRTWTKVASLPKALCRAPGEGCGSPPPASSVILAVAWLGVAHHCAI